ncbi:MAG TPA: Zn-dependent alcohol dehydrogenase [Dehalococcoidia bacterium]|nr:Zn-dependent alcohol dehydrogenase [Dehalococcoidia bacterium]
MKAAVCYEYGKPLSVEKVNLDPPQKGEVKVKVAATAVCHSDIHVLRGELGGGQLPIVAGHETAGYIEEIGEGVISVKPGDHVVVSLLKSCRRCRQCVTGNPHLCETPFPLMTESRLHNMKGENLRHMVGTATFAEYAIVDESQVVKIADDMPMDRAALLGCGVITGFGAVVNRAKVETLSSVVVVGTGGVGLNAVQGAVFSGAYPIIAVDMLDSKLEAARKFGATHTVNGSQGDAVEKVKEITSGKGADYVFVTVGSASAVQQSLDMVGTRGMLVVVGLPGMGATITIPPFLWGERMITSSTMGTTRLSVDVPKLVDLYKAGQLKLDELITKHYPLDEINEAIESVERGEALRNIIAFE